MITAKEALELTQNQSSIDMKMVENAIIEASNKGEYSVTFRGAEFERMASIGTDISKHPFVIEMKSLGYSVNRHYEERQFVDLGITVSWASIPQNAPPSRR